MIKVERHSFFHVEGGGSLRFTETSPTEAAKEHSECNCTKAVHVRPSGEPSQVTKEFYVITEGSSFQLSRLWLVFGDHAHFRFHSGESVVNIEIAMPGYGLFNLFSGKLLFGRDVDTSKLVNGWLPSKLADSAIISPDQLWVHRSCSGEEAIRLLSKPDEVMLWREVFFFVSKLDTRMDVYRLDKTTPVDTMRTNIENDEVVAECVAKLTSRLAPVVAGLKDTELFKICDEVSTDAREKSQRRERMQRV